MQELHDISNLPFMTDDPYYPSPSSTLSSVDQASLLLPLSPHSAIPMFRNYSSHPTSNYFSMPFPDIYFNPTPGLQSNNPSFPFAYPQSVALTAPIDDQSIQRCLDPSLVFGAPYQSIDHFKASLPPTAHASPITSVDSVLALTPPLKAVSTENLDQVAYTNTGTSSLAVVSDVIRPAKALLEHGVKLQTKGSREAESVLQGGKRSRTAQACEKCRIRKARVSLTNLSFFTD